MNKTFGQTLKELRKESKMTLQELAMRSGLSIMTLSNWENDKYKPRQLSALSLKYPLMCDIKFVGKEVYLIRKENKYGN